MKFTFKQSYSAFTRVDLAVVVGVIVLFVITLHRLAARNDYGPEVRCMQNLKQVAIGFRIFAIDHGDLYPSQVTNSPAFENTRSAWIHFQAMSNELGSAKSLICPTDKERTEFIRKRFDNGNRGLGFVGNKGVSYFAGLSASETNLSAISAGDRNVMITNRALNGAMLQVRSNDVIRWRAMMHTNWGHLAYADGSVQAYGPYRSYKDAPELVDQRWLLPLVP